MPTADSCAAAKFSLNHLVGGDKQSLRHGNAERFGGFQINDQLEFGRLQDREIGGLLEKMAASARALGWPEQIVDATRAQLQTVTKTQIQMMDQMMDAWEEQIKSPNPSAMLSKLKPLPGFGPAGSWPNVTDMSAINPMQFYAQFAEQWQKAWSDGLAFWTRAGKRN